jgi:hypothetical protein
MTMTLRLLYRYRPALQRYPLLRPLQVQVQVRPIQIMSSQPPQILSIEDLNTTDAKYVFVSPQKARLDWLSFTLTFLKRWVSLKKINWQDQSGRKVSRHSALHHLSFVCFS